MSAYWRVAVVMAGMLKVGMGERVCGLGSYGPFDHDRHESTTRTPSRWPPNHLTYMRGVHSLRVESTHRACTFSLTAASDKLW